jgi:hypothetical protein
MSFLDTHHFLSAILAFIACFVVGLFEKYAYKSAEIACGTWWLGIVIASFGLSTLEGLGVFRWFIAIGFFLMGSLIVIVYARSDR